MEDEGRSLPEPYKWAYVAGVDPAGEDVDGMDFPYGPARGREVPRVRHGREGGRRGRVLEFYIPRSVTLGCRSEDSIDDGLKRN